jgi:nucleotide-binding universal stress UspA family protein
MIKDLLVHLSLGAKRNAAAEYAVALGDAFDAHVAAMAFAYDPIIPVTVLDGMPTDFMDAQRREGERAANLAKEKFDRAAGAAGVRFDSHVFSTSIAGAADHFGRMARRFDLSVVMQAEADMGAAEEVITEAALFESGRPVIVVPYIHKGGLKTDTIMVCWDAGRTAARAMGDALPLLARAKKIDVVMVTGEDRKRDSVPGADVGEHLARHGLNVEVKRIVASGDIAGTLLSYAADSGADMIVMGGYGHSRLREFILGGVTRELLKSMTVPCLMSH